MYLQNKYFIFRKKPSISIFIKNVESVDKPQV